MLAPYSAEMASGRISDEDCLAVPELPLILPLSEALSFPPCLSHCPCSSPLPLPSPSLSFSFRPQSKRHSSPRPGQVYAQH